MKRIYVKEEWCLGCHLCEYNCAFANSGMTDMVKALRGKTIYPRIQVEQDETGVGHRTIGSHDRVVHIRCCHFLQRRFFV